MVPDKALASNDNLPVVIPDTSPETEIVRDGDVLWVCYDGTRICELGRKKALPDAYVHHEAGYSVGRCKLIKANGDRCKNPVRPGWKVCRSHGAGYRDKPGGLNNKQIVNGKYANHLPAKLLTAYEEFVEDPDIVSMRNEMALLDARIIELVDTIGTSTSEDAWFSVRRACGVLGKKDIYEEDVEEAVGLLGNALVYNDNDDKVWKDLMNVIDNRRKLAETERRRIVDAQHTMTYEQANMIISYMMTSIRTHVEDPEILRAISEDMRRLDM